MRKLRQRSHSITHRRRRRAWLHLADLANIAALEPLDDDLRRRTLKAIAERMNEEGAIDPASLFEDVLRRLGAIDDALLAEAVRRLAHEARRRIRKDATNGTALADSLNRLAALPAIHTPDEDTP